MKIGQMLFSFKRIDLNGKFEEETGVRVDTWEEFLRIEHRTHDSFVYFFRAFDTEAQNKVEIKTDELIWLVGINRNAVNYSSIIPNLKWIIPLALDLEYQPLVTMTLR